MILYQFISLIVKKGLAFGEIESEARSGKEVEKQKNCPGVNMFTKLCSNYSSFSCANKAC